MKVSKREKKLLIIVLLLAVVCVYYLMFLKPYMTEISVLKERLIGNEAQVETYSQLKSSIDEINIQIEQKEVEIKEYSVNISTGFDQPPVLVYLEDTVDKHAQKMMFVFGMAEYVGKMTISPVTITMTTTYDGLTGFIDEVTKGEYIVNVTSIEAAIIVSEEIDNQEFEPAGEEDTEDALPGEDVLPPEDEAAAKEDDSTILVDNPDNLLKVMINLEIYTMAGNIPSNEIYTFDDNSYTYGGDIFY